MIRRVSFVSMSNTHRCENRPSSSSTTTSRPVLLPILVLVRFLISGSERDTRSVRRPGEGRDRRDVCDELPRLAAAHVHEVDLLAALGGSTSVATSFAATTRAAASARRHEREGVAVRVPTRARVAVVMAGELNGLGPRGALPPDQPDVRVLGRSLRDPSPSPCTGRRRRREPLGLHRGSAP